MKLKGTPVSSGIAIGRAHLISFEEIPIPSYEIAESEADNEVSRFNRALNLVVEELENVKEAAKISISDESLAIFDVHIAILKDPTLKRNTITRIIKERKNAEAAFQTSVRMVLDILENSPDPYFRERVIDIKDLAAKVQMRMLGNHKKQDLDIPDPILISSQLSPSQTGPFQQIVKAFVTEHGGKTSHTAILARSLEIPAVVGVSGAVSSISQGDEIIVDGIEGLVIVKPTPQEKAEYLEKINAYRERREKLILELKKPSRTIDGHHIKLRCNIDLEEELEKAAEFGAEGIGLYRSEFLYLKCAPALPSEEEHYQIYKKISESAFPYKATIRTLDLGGERYFHKHLAPTEANPVLGLRALRFSLKHYDIFKTQLRGILRASTKKNIEIMFPMVTSLEDIQMAKAVLREAQESLKRENIPYDEEIKVGIMIEVPICALNAEAFANNVDFFSVGTNDLIQYLMAIDRNNEGVANYYDPYHPAFLRLLLNVASTAKRHKIPISICGETASDPDLIPLFIGLGIDEFSMTPQAIPDVKAKIISLSYKDCRKIALEATKAWSGEEVRRILKGGKTKSGTFLGVRWKKRDKGDS
ncbi:MAG: phosphoenolpyruvate--protein phosphotransferase [Acidobacteriota bacterium]